MCSVDTCNDLPVEKKLYLTGATCRKCDSEKAKVVLQGKFPYCRECFLIYFKHKYSSGIGKAKILRPHDKVLIAFSGSFSSLCLLNLAHSSLVEERKKKTIFDVVLVFIDDNFDKSDDVRHHVFQCLSNMVAAYHYKLFYACLTPFGEDIVLEEDSQSLIGHAPLNLKYILEGFTSNTSKIDFIEKLRLHNIYDAAKKLNCTKIFTAETTDHIATKIIGNIATGKGKTLSTDTGFISNFEDIPLVRPLRECSKKEVVFYNVFNNLHSHAFPWFIESDKFSSIQKLTESFITELHQSFPSTVATVTSTGGKISLEGSNERRCILCKAHMNNAKDLTAEEAMKFSKIVTTCGPKHFDPSNFSMVENGEGSTIQIVENLSVCYSCAIFIRESKCKQDLLKLWIKVLKEGERQKMYDDIKDFLI